MVPEPVAVCRKLGCGAGAAFALGTRLQEPSAFFFSGAFWLEDPLVIFCSSATFRWSAESAKVSFGVWKFAMLRLPLAFVDPSDAARFVKFTEFWVNCMFALRTFSG